MKSESRHPRFFSVILKRYAYEVDILEVPLSRKGNISFGRGRRFHKMVRMLPDTQPEDRDNHREIGRTIFEVWYSRVSAFGPGAKF